MTSTSCVEDALDIRLRHAQYLRAFQELQTCLNAAEACQGGIVPLLGPTRIGKTDLLADARERLGEAERGAGALLATWSFAVGRVPPKPNDRDLYRAMLQAIGYDCGPRERTGQVRDRLLAAIRAEGIHVIAMDECSHCAEPGANLSPRAAADHFKTVVDETGVTLVLSGLPKFQKLIDQNEQFRDRSTETVLFLPYSWSEEQDRLDFTGVVLSVLQIVKEVGISLDFDDLDMVRRLYAASGGRAGIVLRIFKVLASRRDRIERVSFADVAEASRVCLQGGQAGERYFDPREAPSDTALVQSYVSVLQEAGMPFSPRNLNEFEGARQLAKQT